MADTQATFAFHRSLYLPQAVRAAVEAFEGYVESATVEEGTHELVVTLSGYDPGYGDAFGDEFANYVLGQTVIQTREAMGR